MVLQFLDAKVAGLATTQLHFKIFLTGWKQQPSICQIGMNT